MSSVIGWLVAYLFRWFPHSTQTGLRKIGNPDPDSPVIVTCNFSLTVKRVLRALQGQNLWLLVAPSDGINVWCASCGGIFTHNRVIDAIKVSGLAEKVKHRILILPALSAPGMNRKAIKEETGFHARFGPVHARDIPDYIGAGMKKPEGSGGSDAMCRFRFDLKHRLDMLLSMNFIIYLPVAIAIAVIRPQYFIPFSLLFWFAVVFLYLFVNHIPGRSGWAQVLLTASALVIIWAVIDWLRLGDPLIHWGWFIASLAIFFTAGFDLAGIATGRKSDAEALVARLGFKSFGKLYQDKKLGTINLDRDKCKGCKTCIEICPVGVYGKLDKENKTTFRDRDACFACSACVMQCPEGALSLSKE
jgi:NAD-dependent dihydropyrimidine dehydrogenase PreA subunit